MHLRGWLPLIKQIAEEIGMDYVEKRSPTKVFGIVSKLDDCDVNKIISPVRLICDAMGFYHHCAHMQNCKGTQSLFCHGPS